DPGVAILLTHPGNRLRSGAERPLPGTSGIISTKGPRMASLRLSVDTRGVARPAYFRSDVRRFRGGRVNARRDQEIGKRQKDNLSPNCTSRGRFIAEVTIPKFGFPTCVFGSANCTRLNRLKNSVRKSRLIRSVMCVCLLTVKSQLAMPAAFRTGSVRGSLPK